MTRRGRAAFLVLILTQAAHSIEEYVGRLYDVFPPARMISSLLSVDRRIGFAVFNAALVAFGLGCFFGTILRGSRAAVGLAWFWAALELMNGALHIAWALSSGGYRPGVATAPFLVVTSLVLVRALRGPKTVADAG